MRATACTPVLATTGTLRRTCLIYGTSGDAYVVAAKGVPRRTDVVHEPRVGPGVGVQIGTHRITARARAASSAERAPLWALMVNILPFYDDYAQKSDRGILCVLLAPPD